MKKVLKEEILNLRKKGYSYKKIRKELNCTISVISYHCKNANLASPNSFKKPSIEEIENFNKLYLEGKTGKEIGITLGFSKQTVFKYLTVPKRKSFTIKSRSQSVVDWRKKNKEKLVEYKGGKCSICGYNNSVAALTFHHLNPLEKDFTISGKSWSFETLKKEVDKCILLCSNCHIEVHQGLHKNKGL